METLLSADQRRISIDLAQTYASYRAVENERRAYAGGMSWRRIGENEYLYRLRGRRGYGKSLGPRSAQTEAIYERFVANKRDLAERSTQLRDAIARQARFAVAAGVNRVPRAGADIFRVMDQMGVTGAPFRVVGSYALYAFEAHAGVSLRTGLLQTNDIDVLFDPHARVKLVADAGEPSTIALLRRVDPSFRTLRPGHFRATSKDGTVVELIKPVPRPPHRAEARQWGQSPDDLAAAEIETLIWLINSPAFEATVVGANGFPARMAVPDPRYFAAHKLALSERSDRDPMKRPRDRAQALAVIRLTALYFPDLPFDDTALRPLPAWLRERTRALAEQARSASASPRPGMVPGL